LSLEHGGTNSYPCDIQILTKRACIFCSGGIFILAVLKCFHFICEILGMRIRYTLLELNDETWVSTLSE
jgi:hypothetical protein